LLTTGDYPQKSDSTVSPKVCRSRRWVESIRIAHGGNADDAGAR
jgi:hypothetical protein